MELSNMAPQQYVPFKDTNFLLKNQIFFKKSRVAGNS